MHVSDRVCSVSLIHSIFCKFELIMKKITVKEINRKTSIPKALIRKAAAIAYAPAEKSASGKSAKKTA